MLPLPTHLIDDLKLEGVLRLNTRSRRCLYLLERPVYRNRASKTDHFAYVSCKSTSPGILKHFSDFLSDTCVVRVRACKNQT